MAIAGQWHGIGRSNNNTQEGWENKPIPTQASEVVIEQCQVAQTTEYNNKWYTWDRMNHPRNYRIWKVNCTGMAWRAGKPTSGWARFHPSCPNGMYATRISLLQSLTLPPLSPHSFPPSRHYAEPLERH